MTTQTFTDGVSLSAAAWATDVDTATYSYLTSLAGQNALTATGPTSMTGYATGQMFRFTPVSTNTVSTTLAITANSVALGAKNIFYNGAQLTGGELVAGTPVNVIYDGTRFQIDGPYVPAKFTAALGADVALSTTGNYFDGPSVAQGTAGTWLVSGTITALDSAGAAGFLAKLWDGTTVIASGQQGSTGAGSPVVIALSGYISSPAGNLRISVRDSTTTNGLIKFNSTGNSKDSTITAFRIG